MLNVYSIEEIIKSSDKILQTNESINNISIKKDHKINIETTEKYEDSLPLDKEVLLRPRTKISIINYNKDDVVNNLHVLFKGKLKRNTIKLIVDLKEEIIDLNNKILLLKTQHNDVSNSAILLKDDVHRLMNVERKLEYNKKKDKEEIINLKNQLTTLKTQHNDVSNSAILLKDDVHKLMNVERNLQYNLKKSKLDFNLLKKEDENLELKFNKTEAKKKFYNNKIKELKHNNKNLENEIIKYELLKNINKEKLTIITKLESKITYFCDEINSYKNELEDSNKKNTNLQKIIDDLKSNMDNNNQDENIDNQQNKIKYYQEENLRISSELTMLRNKSEIMSDEINNFHSQRTHLIDKLNSVNEVIKSTNIVTSPFTNPSERKHNLTPNKNTDKIEINKRVSDIFDK